MILVDAGPMISLIDADDGNHEACCSVMKSIRPPLLTVWPAVVEAMYLLDDFHAQDALWQMLIRGIIMVAPLEASDLRAVRDLMAKYRRLPMDLADAALVRVAERERIATVFTLERRDFSIYRANRRPLKVIP